MPEINAVIETLGNEFNVFKARYDGKVNALEKQLDAIESAVALSGFKGGGSTNNNTVNREHKEAFLSWMRKGANTEALRDLEIQANLSTMEDPSGGYLVPVEMDKEIERLALDSVAIRRISRVVPAKGDYQKPLSKGGATGGWVGEKDTRTETDTPELTLFSPPWCEVYANPSVTQKLLDTSDFDIAAWLIEETNDVFVAKEGTAFISGNGVGQPKGILAYDTIADASWTYGKVGYIAGGHATLLNNVDKLFDLQHALKPVYRQNATWLMNDTTLSVIRKLKDGDGNYLWRPGLQENAPDTLLGKPVEIDDNMPDIGANAYPIAFGNFIRAYTIVDHVAGIRLLRDPYTTKGFVYFYTTKRVAGGISNYEAVKLLKIAAA
jgi:HK97 family phage major capsid protein